MIELTQDQLGRIAATAESPPTMVDPETKAAYVLLPRELYERMCGDLDDVRQMAPLLADIDPEDWEDVSAYEGKP